MKTLIISLLSITVSVTCLVYTWRSDASNKKRFALMQEMSDKQDAMQANLNGVIDSSNYSLLHLEPLESKVPQLESNLSDLQKGLKSIRCINKAPKSTRRNRSGDYLFNEKYAGKEIKIL